MKLINRYLLRSHTAPFIMGTFTVVFLFFFQFLILNLDKLIGKGLDNWTIVQLISYQMPSFIVLAIPMGVLFSTIMAFGSMSANHEITIIKSSGGSLIRMMTPVLISSIFITYFTYWFNNEVLPDANHASKILMRDISQKKPTFGLDKGQFSNQLDGFTILARDIDSASSLMKALTIYDNRDFEKRNIISADSGYIRYDANSEKMVIDLYYGEIIQYPENSVNNMQKIDFKEYRLFIDAVGFNLNRSENTDDDRGDRELKIADMQLRINKSKETEKLIAKKFESNIRNHINKILLLDNAPKDTAGIEKGFDLENAELDKRIIDQNQNQKQQPSNIAYDTLPMGQQQANYSSNNKVSPAKQSIAIELNNLQNQTFADAQMISANRTEQKEYLVEIHKKYAIPFACIVFVLVGCPLGVRSRGGNFGLSAGISLGFFILYWACLIAGEKFADRGLISPWLGMWLGNIIVGFLGIILTLKVNNENLNIIANLKRRIFNQRKIVAES